MKFLYIICVGFLLLSNLNAQEVSIFGQRSMWHADNLCDVEFACDYRLYVTGGQFLIGYAYHPNGQLWMITTTSSPNQAEYLRIYSVKINGCQYSLLYNIQLPAGWRVTGAANIDHLGRLYIRLNQRDSITNELIPTLTRIADPANPVFEPVLYTDISHKFWEVHFEMDRIYLIDIDKPYIRVYSNDFILIDTLIMNKHIWGLTALTYGCDSLVTYATHMGYSTDVFDMIGPDTMMYISEYDLQTNILSPVCQYWMGDKVANTNLTSPLEFLSSDPECDLLLDLDRDNSTGVYPYDYRDSTDYCFTLLAPICDPDVYIHTSAPLDSIVLILSGIQEPGDERLILSPLPPGIMFSQRNAGTYVLTSTNPTDDSYKAAILAIRYQHDGAQRTPGTRSITLQGFNAIKDGVKITATIHISGLPYAGADATLLICTDTLIQQLSAITGGQSGGYWWPALSAGSDIFDSQSDAASQYHYIVVDPVCGNDTAVISITRDASAPVDLLGADQALCAGDTIDMLIQQSATSIVWDDGSIGASRQVTTSGEYWVAVETSGGCIYRDSIHVDAGAIWTPLIETTDPICGQPNGQIAIDPVAFGQEGSILINGAPMVSPTLSTLPQGSYQITSISNDGCQSETSATLNNQPFLAVSLDTQVVVTHGLWKSVEYTLQNSVPVADILFNPNTSIQWTGTSIEVYGDKDIVYEITFVDDNGCSDIQTFSVKVEKEEGIYLPNIFNPASISGNDVWKPSISESYKLEVLRIYDRWGSMVHQSTTDPTWDGTHDGQGCPPGVFVYQLILTHLADGERLMMSGDISLIR